MQLNKINKTPNKKPETKERENNRMIRESESQRVSTEQYGSLLSRFSIHLVIKKRKHVRKIRKKAKDCETGKGNLNKGVENLVNMVN